MENGMRVPIFLLSYFFVKLFLKDISNIGFRREIDKKCNKLKKNVINVTDLWFLLWPFFFFTYIITLSIVDLCYVN